MDVNGAIEATLKLAVKERMPAIGAFSYDHLLDMKRRIDESDMSYGKLCRWLAWMQAALYHSELVDLEGLKDLSRGFADPKGPPTVAIGGSMSRLDAMFRIHELLGLAGFACRMPFVPEPPLGEVGTEARSKLARLFMDGLADPATKALLIVNGRDGEEANYVGPSAFSEAAVAFSHRKPVYLFGDLPEVRFRDELTAFGAIPLRGDLSALRDALAPAN